jgi:hypothetical protein
MQSKNGFRLIFLGKSKAKLSDEYFEMFLSYSKTVIYRKFFQIMCNSKKYAQDQASVVIDVISFTYVTN